MSSITALEALPTELRDGLLYLFLAGPGVGESVILRLPGGQWVVVDCWEQGGSILPWTCVLEKYGVTRVQLLVLTHPHHDHYKGIVGLLDKCEAESVAFVGAPDNREIPAIPRLPDLSNHDGCLALHLGGAGATLNRLYDHVASHRSVAIHLEAGVLLLRDDATKVVVECLSPSQSALQAFFTCSDWHKRYLTVANEFSAVLKLTWKDWNLILGGDLPARGSNGNWGLLHPVHEHRMLKIPHHSSAGSISPAWTGPRSNLGRLWLTTAYSSKGLPRFDDDEGLHQILRMEDRVLLSARPRPHETLSATRAELAIAPVANPNPSLFNRVSLVDPYARTPETSLVGACFDSLGRCQEYYVLPGAVEVLA